MLSLKHFVQLIAIIVILSVMFLYLNVNNRTLSSADSANSRLILPEQSEEEEREDGKQEDGQTAFYVVFSGGSEMERNVYENVCRYLTWMKLSWETVPYVTEGELVPDLTLIFCNTKVSEGMAVDVLGSYIEQGGRALFAAGLPEGYTDSYLYPLWGIVEKGNRLESTVWLLHEGFLPVPETTVRSTDFEASTRVGLADGAQIYMEDEENRFPVVYGYGYGEGKSVIINSTLMQNRCSGGVFAAALGALLGELMYPAIGTVSVFLDDFPFLMAGYDKNCAAYYGRSMESFERDILWPVLVSYASGYGIKYTMNLYEPQEELKEDQINERLLSFLVKENLRYSGEIMFSGYYGGGGKKELLKLFRTHFPAYEIQAFAGRLPEGAEEKLNAPETGGEVFPIVRGSYTGDGKRAAGQDFGFDGETVSFPVMSAGFSMKEAAYPYLAGIGLYGVVSHSLPITQLITASSVEESYEGVKKDMGELLSGLGRETGWLTPATVTEAAGRAAFCHRLSVRLSRSENGIRAVCENIAKGQCFLLRTERKPERVTGGSIVEAGPGWYLLEAEEAEITVTMKEQETGQ